MISLIWTRLAFWRSTTSCISGDSQVTRVSGMLFMKDQMKGKCLKKWQFRVQ